MSVNVVVEVATNEFERDGLHGGGDGVTYKLVTLSRLPDPATEKFNGNYAIPDIVAKSGAEVTAADLARLNKQADDQFLRAIQAAAAALYKDFHGAFPNTAQKAALRADFVTAWKALG